MKTNDELSPEVIVQRLEGLRRLCELATYLRKLQPLVEAAERLAKSPVR